MAIHQLNATSAEVQALATQVAALQHSVSLTTTTTVTDFLVPASGMTITGSLTMFGKIAFMYLMVNTSSAQSAKWLAATVKSDYRPANYAYGVEWISGAAFELGKDGRLRLNSAVNAGNCYVSFTYMLA